jgi:UDP-GlcNAc:undecaprenyl-phosphate GlcNAc-1-phosphate transferase
MSTWFAAAEGRWLDGFRAPLVVGVLAVVISWLLTPQVRKLAMARGAMDDPEQDERRIHKSPLPRWGGLAVYGGLVGSLLLVLPFAFPVRPFPLYLIGIFLVGALIVVVGALDDLYQYRARVQMLFLLAVGVAIQFIFDDQARIQISGIAVPLFSDSKTWKDFGWVAFPITAIYIFVITKTMDTIDGVDGLASGIAAISGATLSVIATYGGQPRVALVSAALAGAAIGFLRYNYNPAKIILGTGGSQLLGFVLACLSIVGAMKTAAAVAILVPMLAFGIPIIDAIQVMFRRLREGHPLTQGDTRHLHHQLLHRGLSQRQTVWVLYVAALALCGVLLVIVRLYG